MLEKLKKVEEKFDFISAELCKSEVVSDMELYKKYMQELKLNEAKLLLTTTTRPVKDISYSLKYENPEYFSMFFKRRTSKTPLEYRNQSRRHGKEDREESDEKMSK